MNFAFFLGIPIEVEVVDFFKRRARGPLIAEGFVDFIYKGAEIGWYGSVYGLEGGLEIYFGPNFSRDRSNVWLGRMTSLSGPSSISTGVQLDLPASGGYQAGAYSHASGRGLLSVIIGKQSNLSAYTYPTSRGCIGISK